MEPLVQIPVAPGASFTLPPKLEGLRRLAYNLWWAWHPEARTLFSRIDAGRWARFRNPIPLLAGNVNWAQLLDNPAFMAEYEEILREFDAYMANGSDHWFERKHGDARATGRSPTSARSTGSTSRWASTPAASASSPAIT